MTFLEGIAAEGFFNNSSSMLICFPTFIFSEADAEDFFPTLNSNPISDE